MTDANTPPEPPTETPSDASKITALSERLSFFFSNANLRQDKWMRLELQKSNCLTLDTLLKFKTIQSISEDTELLKRAAKGEDGEYGERIKKLIVLNEETGEVRRVEPFDYKTMGDGSSLSLYVKNIPLTEEDGGRQRYAVTRDEVKALFEPYGHVAIVNLRFGKKEGERRSVPLGKVVVEFQDEDGVGKAVADLVAPESEKKDDGDVNDEEGDTANAEPKTVLELKGNTLTVEKMLPHRMFQNKDGKKKRSLDGENEAQDNEEAEEKVEFEPVTLDWEKGLVIGLTGLNPEKCDRESIREAVSDILKVSKDIKVSGLYVDYSRGDTEGNLRLKDGGKDAEMKELVEKLTDGSVLIADDKVGSAKILEGEEEEKYYEKYIKFLNDKKRQREEEKAANKKRRFSGGGRGRGRGRGRR
jgi:RNA recognition motif-containing protein